MQPVITFFYTYKRKKREEQRCSVGWRNQHNLLPLPISLISLFALHVHAGFPQNNTHPQENLHTFSHIILSTWNPLSYPLHVKILLILQNPA